jgi:magnesium transporter
VQKLGMLNSLNAKTHDSLNSLLRMQTFYRDELGNEQPQLTRRLEVLLHETQTLADQSNFLSSQINFQLEASLGLINVEQNLISKIFTVATVCFLPMTVISGIYGMNFEHMPELHWLFGYPFAIAMMLLAPAGTYFFLKNKGWL